VSYVTGVYIASVLFLWSLVAVPVMWVVVSAPEMCVSAPEMCCLGHNVSLWGRTYIRVDFDAMCGGDFRSTFYVGARWAKGHGNTEIRTVQSSTRQKKRHNNNNKNNKIRTV
jgi:hypothetical protein